MNNNFAWYLRYSLNQFEWLLVIKHQVWDETYLKNSLEGTALEIRKYQTGFLGLLWVFGGVVFPLASWKISGKAGFSTRFMEQLKEFFSQLATRCGGVALYFFAALEKWLLKLQLFVVPICNQMQLVFYSTLLNLTTYCWPHFLTDHLSHLSVQNAFVSPLFLSLQAVALFLLRVIFPNQQNRIYLFWTLKLPIILKNCWKIRCNSFLLVGGFFSNNPCWRITSVFSHAFSMIYHENMEGLPWCGKVWKTL